MLKIFKTGLGVFCLSWFLVPMATAEIQVRAYAGASPNQTICNAKSDHTNLRSAPSAKDSRIYQSLSNGEPIEINGTVTNEAGALWYEVVWAGDEGDVIGFVIASAVAPSCGDSSRNEMAKNTDTGPYGEPNVFGAILGGLADATGVSNLDLPAGTDSQAANGYQNAVSFSIVGNNNDGTLSVACQRGNGNQWNACVRLLENGKWAPTCGPHFSEYSSPEKAAKEACGS